MLKCLLEAHPIPIPPFFLRDLINLINIFDIKMIFYELIGLFTDELFFRTCASRYRCDFEPGNFLDIITLR